MELFTLLFSQKEYVCHPLIGDSKSEILYNSMI